MNSIDSNTAATCRACPKLCRHVCPPALGEMSETLTPTHKMNLVALWQEGQIGLDQDLAEVFYACNDCGACTSRCQLKQNPAESLYAARAIAYQKQVIPQKVKEVVERHHTHGNPFGPIEAEPPHEQANVQILPGCSLWYHKPEEDVETLRQALQQSHTQPVKVCHPEHCCGSALYAAGAMDDHRNHANLFVHHHRHVTSLVVADPHCAHHIRSVYPRLGLNLPFQVIHYLQAVERNNLSRKHRSGPTNVFYLDPSPLGRHSGIYLLPRRWLNDLNYEVLEFVSSHNQALDSAAGGIYRWTSPDGALRHAHQLLMPVRQMSQNEANVALITVGESERSHLEEANPDLKIFDLNDWLAKAILRSALPLEY